MVRDKGMGGALMYDDGHMCTETERVSADWIAESHRKRGDPFFRTDFLWELLNGPRLGTVIKRVVACLRCRCMF